MASYTNFCCRAGGNNLNAGSVDGSTTEPATAAKVTYTGGDWTSGTDVYVAPVGADMTEAVVGRFAALYVDGDTAPTTNQYLVARITVVNAGTRQITLSTTARSLLGTEVATGTGTRSLRIGGAWAGPSGASGFPLNFLTSGMVNAAGNLNRINLKNDQTYTVSAAITYPTSGWKNLHGYSSAFGDGGRAVIDGGIAGAAYTVLTIGSNGDQATLVGLEFRNNGATGGSTTIHGLSLGADGIQVRRCVFHDLRGSGVLVSSSSMFSECEFYACNQSNTNGCGGIRATTGASVSLVRCIFHDNAGSNGVGVYSGSGAVLARNCVFDSNVGGGILLTANSCHAIGCDFYNNGGSGVNVGNYGGIFDSCNFVKNVGAGVNAIGNTGVAVLYNCGFGSGTMANAGGNVSTPASAEEIGSITYAADVTPWVDPANGDFRITHQDAIGTGRGSFLQTAVGYTGTTSAPNIGAARVEPTPEEVAEAVWEYASRSLTS